MKELTTRALSGLLFATILIGSIQLKHACIALFFVFGLICLSEFNKLIHQRNIASYIIFIGLFLVVAFWETIFKSNESLSDISQILLVISVLVNLLLIRDLFSSKSLPTLLSNHFINTTFYVSSGFVFLLLIALNFENYNPEIIKSTELYRGISPARYGNRAGGGVLDVITSGGNAENWRGNVNVDLATMNFAIDGPIDKAGRWTTSLGYRRSYLDLLLQSLSSDKRISQPVAF